MIHTEFGHVLNLGYNSSMLMISAFKLILVPVWVTEIKAHERTSCVLINGRNGSIHSEIQERGLAGWLENMLGGQ
jgi:hypothetical protein